MYPTKVVVREVQSDSGFQVRQLLAERIREPRKSSHCHPDCEVLPSDKASRNLLRIGIALSDLGYNPRDAWWGVPRFGSIELPIIAKHFCQLREIYVQPKAVRHSSSVKIDGLRMRSARSCRT